MNMNESKGLLAVVIFLSLMVSNAASHAVEWREYSSENFVLYTAGSEKEARQTLIQAEQFRQALGRFLPLIETRPMNIVMYGSPMGLDRTKSGQEVVAFFTNVSGRATVFTGPSHLSVNRQNMIQYHYVYHQMAPRGWVARWLRNGFVEFFASAQIRGDKITFGEVDGRHGWPKGPYTPILDGLMAGAIPADDAHGVVRTWYFVHYVMLGALRKPPVPDYRSSLGKYLELSENRETAGSAFVTAFGKTPTEMEAELYSYAGSKSLATITYPLQAYAGTISVNPVQNYKSELFQSRIVAKRNWKEEIKYLERAEKELLVYLASFPQDIDALAAMTDVSRRMSRGQSDQERRRALHIQAIEYGERALAIDPTLTLTRHDVATVYRVQGNKDESLRHLYQIYEQNRYDLDAIRWLGQILGGDKRYQEALPFLEEMMRWEPENSWILKLLEEARQHAVSVDEAPTEDSPRAAH